MTQPPSRRRYAQTHPTLPYRVPRSLLERLKEELARREIGFAELLAQALDGASGPGPVPLPTDDAGRPSGPDLAQVREEGRCEGWRDALALVADLAGPDCPCGLAEDVAAVLAQTERRAGLPAAPERKGYDPSRKKSKAEIKYRSGNVVKPSFGR